jgi:hypothetical protein
LGGSTEYPGLMLGIFCAKISILINFICMSKKPLFWETFLLLALVGTLDQVARMYNLYWTLNEFDSLLHFLGGAFVSSLFLWVFFFSGFFAPAKRNFRKFFLISTLSILFVAVVWEIYELILGEATFAKSEYPFDTSLDFFMDFLGAYAVCFYAFIRELKYKISNLDIRI